MDLKEAVDKAKKKKHESYQSLIPKINEEIEPLGFRPLKHRQELAYMVDHGYSDTLVSKNNAVLDALLKILKIESDKI